VGDRHHLTFFEMLGNWSLGDYFKDLAIRLSYEFLTSREWLGFDPRRLSVTVFAGDGEVPPDQEAAAVWRSLGIPEERLHFLGREDNWWGPAGQSGPCGPDTEMFIDTGSPPCSPECRPGCKCGKYFEIWNNVSRTRAPEAHLSSRRLWTCGTHLRATGATARSREMFQSFPSSVQAATGAAYGQDPAADRSIRIIADHIRSAVYILGDEKGVTPSNLGQGYILRRLIRRAIRHARKLGASQDFLDAPARAVLEAGRQDYPELERRGELVLGELAQEEKRFLATLQRASTSSRSSCPIC
jgi:alanyl-tRNA synthetase